jgi:predicted nucleic-acid-binding Zn-ribbon protein
MDNTSPCPNCGGRELFRSEEVEATSVHGPNVLPWLGRLFHRARMSLVLCRDCGLVRFFADTEARAKVPESTKWKRL